MAAASAVKASREPSARRVDEQRGMSTSGPPARSRPFQPCVEAYGTAHGRTLDEEELVAVFVAVEEGRQRSERGARTLDELDCKLVLAVEGQLLLLDHGATDLRRGRERLGEAEEARVYEKERAERFSPRPAGYNEANRCAPVASPLTLRDLRGVSGASSPANSASLQMAAMATTWLSAACVGLAGSLEILWASATAKGDAPTERLMTVIRFWVSVPVLSDARTDTAPSDSTVVSDLQRMPWRFILRAMTVSDIVTQKGRPSGIKATATETQSMMRTGTVMKPG